MKNLSISYDNSVVVECHVTINGVKRRVFYNHGYAYVSDPRAEGKKTIGLHRYIMEILLERKLLSTEHVHHKDGRRLNNCPDNLEIIDGSEHNRQHTTLRNLKHDPATFACRECHASERPYKADGLCENCWARRRRRLTAHRPCAKCGLETLNKPIYSSMCSQCAAANWNSCKLCCRDRQQLPKKHTPISAEGLCRACRTRVGRAQKKIAQCQYPYFETPLIC
jgi:hypothetical protein